MRRALAATFVAGVAVLGPQAAGIAVADRPDTTDHQHPRPAPAANRTQSAPAPTARAAMPSVRPAAPAASSASKSGTASASTRTPKNPLMSLLFNDGPTLNPTQDPADAGGVVRGALNPDDADGDTLTYTVVRQPDHGRVVIDGSGAFTYTPAGPGQLTSTDTFEVEVTDAGSGFHLHGLTGLINLLTFGLIGTAGHTTTRTVTLDLTAPTGPAATTAYVVPVAPGVVVRPILTVGQSPSTGDYPMVGSPDGLGVYDNNDGTFTLLMNHELGAGSGAVRAHGTTGAFISRYVIDKATLAVISGSDLIQRVYGGNGTAFSRFCSGDLAAGSAYSYNGLGTTARIFLNGEEAGSGRAVATIVTGNDAGSSYVLGSFVPAAGTPAWENLLANPYAQEKTVVIGNNDGGSGIAAGALAVYVGTKQSSGTDAEKAGLTNGVLKFVNVTGNAAEIVDPTTRATNITSGTTFTLSSVASTTFSRPEDGAWNPLNPNEYYFVTTDRLDQVSDGVGNQVGNTRLWRLTFNDITNPDAGGTIDLLIDGDTVNGTKVNMLDNIAVDRTGRILIQEDTGGAAHNAKIWQYTVATDSLELLAKHDPGRFGDIGVPATAPFTIDEESSGIVDAQDVLGPGWFLFDVMAHYPLDATLVEGGQLLALYAP